MMHLLRKAISDDCNVCAAKAFAPCIEPDRQLSLDLGADTVPDADKIAYLEFELLSAARSLRDLQPGHVLVKIIECGLDARFKFRSRDQD